MYSPGVLSFGQKGAAGMPARPEPHADADADADEVKQIGNAAEPGLVNNDVADGLLADSYKLIDLGGLTVCHDDEPPKDHFLPRPSVARMGYPIKHLARR